jgi:hypothetical protein
VAAWVVVVLLFPDGWLPGRRWRLAIWISLAGAVLLFVGQELDANQTVGFSSGRNPLGVDSPLVGAAWAVGTGLLMGGLVAAVASSVLGYRRARGVERQQLKWFAYAGLVRALVMSVAAVFWYRSVLVQVLAGVAFNAMPVAVGVAILRYRLYDIDLLINRTLVYAVLTATLVGAYQLSILLLQMALRPLIADSELAVAGSTLAVAALFRPLAPASRPPWTAASTAASTTPPAPSSASSPASATRSTSPPSRPRSAPPSPTPSSPPTCRSGSAAPVPAAQQAEGLVADQAPCWPFSLCLRFSAPATPGRAPASSASACRWGRGQGPGRRHGRRRRPGGRAPAR